MEKICFVTTVSVTLKTFVLPTAKALQKQGYDVTMICNSDDDFAASLPKGIHYISVQMERGISLSGFSALRELHRILRREKFDLVQYSTPNAACYASIAAKWAHVPVRLYCQWGIAYVGFQGIKRSIFKMIEKMVCHNSTWIEPDSYGNLHFSQQEGLYGAEKSSVIWNGSACGVDLERFAAEKRGAWRTAFRQKHQIAEDALVVGFVGRITRDKGINELFGAMRQLMQENKNAVLLLVGTVENEQTLNAELLQWAQREERVVFTGFSSETEKYYAAMDIFVLPSYREGFGSVVIEAEAMGTPVLVSDIPGPTDAMEPAVTGYTVRVRDTDALLEGLQKMITDPKQLQVMAGKARSFAAERFDAKELTRQIVEDRRRLLDMSR